MENYFIQIIGSGEPKQLAGELMQVAVAFSKLIEATEQMKLQAKEPVNFYMKTKGGLEATISKRD